MRPLPPAPCRTALSAGSPAVAPRARVLAPLVAALAVAALGSPAADAAQGKAPEYQVGDRLGAPASASSATPGTSPASPVAPPAPAVPATAPRAVAEPPVPAAVAGDFRTLDWDALMPQDWDPMKEFKATDFSAMQDGDPRAQAALDKLRQAWDQAPIEPALNQQRVRIAGFVVPLDGTPKVLKEFLLVPYFGACIHVPPPPANQVIHVVMKTPLKGVGAMEPMWVAGTMTTFLSSTPMGTSAYKLAGERSAKYEAPPPR